MKKITLAALVLSSFAASAQAQSNVTVYGQIDLGIAKTSNQTTVQRENHASRLGFRGTEKLDNNLSVIFQLENGFAADTGAQVGGLFDRQAYVGLKGDFGTMYWGRTKDIIDATIGRTDPFIADGVVGKNIEAVLRAKVGVSRVSNAMTYNSPNMNGFAFNAQVALSEVSGGKNGAAILATYDQGPISAHFGYQRPVVTAVNGVQGTLFSLGGGYKFGDLKLTGAYARGDTKVLASGRYTGWMLGANYTVGAGDVKAVYARQNQSNNKVSGKPVLKEFGIGYDHHLSKRTDLYAYMGREQVAKLTSYQFGMSHKF